MLDRIGGEVARATSLVRYDKNSRFPRHTHPLGEEVLVLDGVFSDDSGDYPEGWYLRNPPKSSHLPSSIDGTLIFVKLMQMSLEERRPVRINTRDPAMWHVHQNQLVCPLFSNEQEQVMLVQIPESSSGEEMYDFGAEILVLQGQMRDQYDEYSAGTWLRLPPRSIQTWTSGAGGALIYRKSGHLKDLPTDKLSHEFEDIF